MSCAVVQGAEGVVADTAAPTGHCGGPVATSGGLWRQHHRVSGGQGRGHDGQGIALLVVLSLSGVGYPGCKNDGPLC